MEAKIYLFSIVARIRDFATVRLVNKIWLIGQICPDQIAHPNLVWSVGVTEVSGVSVQVSVFTLYFAFS
jgi:hypothetical protein